MAGLAERSAEVGPSLRCVTRVYDLRTGNKTRAATSATLPRTTQTSVPLYGPLGLAPTRSATAPQRASPSGSVRPRGPADAHAAVHGPPPETRV